MAAEVNGKVKAAYEEAVGRYSQRENVTAIDVGYKYSDGKVLDTIAVRIHVKEKIPDSALEAAEAFPEEIGGVPVDVIQATYEISTACCHTTNPQSVPVSRRRERLTPIQPGLSVAHRDVSAGTFGALVIDNVSGKPAILSNWHVLAGSRGAKPGDPVTQPGSYDGGSIPKDTVASLERMILEADGDAAIALLTGQRSFLGSMFETGAILSGFRDPKLGEVLVKSGRTTGVTYGKVDGLGRYFIQYPVGRKGIDGFKLVARKPGNPDNEEISSGGDSGSVWYSTEDKQGVGLHFAGETNPVPSEEHAVACFLTRVMSKLNISLAAGTGQESAAPQPDVAPMLAKQLGEAVAAGATRALTPKRLEHIGMAVAARYPRLKEAGDAAEPLLDLKAEIGPFGAVAIGFAAGAAARLVGKAMERADPAAVTEAFPLMVAAFLAGAMAGVKAVE